MDLGSRLKLLTIVLVPILIVQAPAAAQELSALGGRSAAIARFDDAQKRVFVTAQLDAINTQRRARFLLDRVQKAILTSRPSWKKTWSASFFTDAKYVGYKDDATLQEYVRDGSWAEAYIGEYDRSSEKLKLRPLIPKQAKTIKIVLP